MRAAALFVILIHNVAHAAPLDVTLHDYFVYRDFVATLEGGATLTLGQWDHHDTGGSWIEVPRLINGEVAGPGTVTSAAFNGFAADPGWSTIDVTGSFQSLEVRGAEDDGQSRGIPGAWTGWSAVTGNTVPAALTNHQYLSYRAVLAGGENITQVDLTMARDVRDAHPRLCVDAVAELQTRCSSTHAHQCSMSSLFANSSHLTAALSGYSESELARIARVMAFEYLITGDTQYSDRARAVLLQLASYDRQHWSDLRDSIQDLGLGWIGLSWMLALDWTWEAHEAHSADLQAIADGTAVFVDYLLEMYKHSDFNNHFHLGRSPVLLAGLAMHGEGVRDADATRYIEVGFDLLFNHEHPGLNSVAGQMGGWHESLGYFDGEMGSPVLIDMDGLRTATGLDMFQDSSFWRTLPSWYLHSTVPWDDTLIHWADQGKARWSTALDGSASEGKGTRQYLTGVARNLRRLGYPEAEQAQQLLDNLIGVYYDSGSYAESFYKVPHHTDVLWYEPGATATPLSNSRLSSHFERLGEVILREGTDADDAMMMFACSDFRGGHQQADNGHFSIWYKGYLAVDSGFYDGWGSSHHYNYARRTIAHNTLTITMPGETFSNTSHNDGGQTRGCDTTYYNQPMESADCDECNMTLSTHPSPYFDFIDADLTASYDPSKVTRVTREMVWIRPDRFVVFDRVDATDASYAKRFLLHGQGAFVDDGGSWHVDDDQGRMFVRTLLPNNAQTTQVGGSGSEWLIGGTNYTPSRGVEFAGTDRLEIAPASAALSDTFLHVLEVADQTQATMTGAAVIETANATGAQVDDWLVFFGTAGAIDGLSYELDNGASVHVVVGDLAPSTAYDIQSGTTSLSTISDEHGVAYFEDTVTGQHTVTVGQGTCPDSDGDSYLDQACGGSDCDDANDQIYPGHGCGGPDGGPTADGAPAPDGGPSSDGGPTGDGTTTTGDAMTPGDDAAGPAAITGGCSCGASGTPALLSLAAALLLRRRR